MNQKWGDVGVDVRVSFLHQPEVFHTHLHLVVDDFALISLQRSSLGMEEQQPQLGAELPDEREHRHDVIALPLLQVEHVEREILLVVVREDIAVERSERNTAQNNASLLSK